MARAAVLPPSPVQRGARTAPRSTLNKTSTASAKAKSAAGLKKRATTAATKSAIISDSDDTDDELGMMMEEHTEQPVRPRGRPAGRPATKTATRAKKATAPAPEESQAESDEDEGQTAQPEPPKKRPGRPRKNPLPEEASAAKAETGPKLRGRPKGTTTAKTSQTGQKATATRKNTRKTAAADGAAEPSGPKQIVIATNSTTTTRSNILRGPAKKKTVTFQDVSDSDSEDLDKPATPVFGSRRGAARSAGAGAGKPGLGGTPVRKNVATAGRGRKPAAAKKDTSQPLSPKKAKQMAKTLSAYASSDGEEDELSAAKVDSPVKLVVHSPAKHGSGNPGLTSPVRKINFTPKKASTLVDENGEPKLPTPKHGSAATGLSSPVRRINFTPNRSQNTVPDNGHLALPPGKAIDFSDTVFMSSPARRPELSPFQFSLRDTPKHGVSKSIPAPVLTPGQASPLKMSPKKGHLGASFSGSPSKALTPSFPARSSLFQSPAKRVASPFKSSVFSSNEAARPGRDETMEITSGSEPEQYTPPKEPEAQEALADEDIEMVEEVARDIFGIELHSGSDSSQESPLSTQSFEKVEAPEPETTEDPDTKPEPAVMSETEDGDIEDKLEELQEEIRREPEDMGTICFGTMEELQEPFKNLDQQQSPEVGMVGMDLNDDYSIEVADVNEQDTVLDSAEPVAEPIESLDAQDIEGLDEQSTFASPSPSEPLLESDALEQAPSSPSVHEDIADGLEQDYDNPGSVRQPDEEQEAESEEEEMVGDEPTLVQSEPIFTILSQPRSPFEVSEGENTSPLQRTQSIPPLAPTPPVGEMAPTSTSHQGSAKFNDRLFDINFEPRIEAENSPFDTTQSEISTPTAPSASNTPCVHGQRKSILGVDIRFTPLAHQLGSWATNTPSQGRPARPRRRGVFSLVGPFEKPTEMHTPTSGDVSYPNLSPTSLANTPRLFAELPHQDDSSITPGSSSTKSPMVEHDHDMIDSPSRNDIFEDSEPATPKAEEIEQIKPHDDVLVLESTEDDEHGDLSDEDKENSNVLSFAPPATPVKIVPEHLRTVHTVSKVPLKGEGEVSPLKLPRKRGLSLSNTSPTRSSPRARKSIFLPRNMSAPSFSPYKAPRVQRSPSPKRRCSTPRRSSEKMPNMAPPKSPSVTASPAKTPRRNASASQQALRGAVVHVDAFTTEGEDASGIFVELLQQMGARCVKTWTWNPHSSLSPVDGVDPKEPNAKVGITHVVYKDGGLRTLEKVKQAAGLVKCVGVGWVLE